MEKVYFRDKEVAHALSISRSTVWHYVRNGLLNKPTKLSERVSVWTRADIDAFVSARSAAGAVSA
ncbi:MAG: helix-turn-helix transcriptional regulator [Sulfuricurvum sp.]